MTVAASNFATSQRTLADLKKLAQESPAEAASYLKDVGRHLPAAEAKTIDELLAGVGDLTERIDAKAALLGRVFAPAPGEWGALQAARSATLGWSGETQGATYLTGKVHLDGEAFVLESPGRRPLKLAEGTANESVDGIPGQWVNGFMNDGDVTVKGTLGADGLTFNVTSFAPVRPGYETFTMARVVVDGADLYLRTPGGERIEVGPELKAQFTGMHRLAVILPGEPREEGGKKIYDRAPASLFALARFSSTAVQQNADGSATALIDMAHEALKGAPAKVAADQVARVNHTWRVWLEGTFSKGPEGQRPAGFSASYVSGAVDTVDVAQWHMVPLAPKIADAGAVDAARELSASS